MSRARTLGLAALVLVGLGASALVACKQTENEHCQVNADCSDGLRCAQATQTCEGLSGDPVDADPPDVVIVVDAPDAPNVDAAADAMLDAMPDAMPDASIDAL